MKFDSTVTEFWGDQRLYMQYGLIGNRDKFWALGVPDVLNTQVP